LDWNALMDRDAVIASAKVVLSCQLLAVVCIVLFHATGKWERHPVFASSGVADREIDGLSNRNKVSLLRSIKDGPAPVKQKEQ
jgi:hypothetical protein